MLKKLNYMLRSKPDKLFKIYSLTVSTRCAKYKTY